MRSSGIEASKKRCRVLLERLERSPLSSKINPSCQRTLFRLINSDLNFLLSLPISFPISSLSVNIGHLEAVVYIIQQPLITNVSRVCKPIPLPSATENGQKKMGSHSNSVHVDIVCTLNRKPVWVIVSDRNPKYVSWHGSRGDKGLRIRIEQLLKAARSSGALKPYSIVLFFAKGLDSMVLMKLKDEFGAYELGGEFHQSDFDFFEELEDEWVNVIARSYLVACVVEITVGDISKLEYGVTDSPVESGRHVILEKLAEMNLGRSFYSLISAMKFFSVDVEGVESVKPGNFFGEDDVINFDTTALVALVSGISNGGCEKLLSASESELRQRFKSNYEFVIKQVLSERQNPIHVELLPFISGKLGIVCDSVSSEFKELISMCGGPCEKLRADQLLKSILVVPDNPSERVMGPPTTRKLALKNKIVFGTGDKWRAPTLTANMGFVRAISQTGMSLFTIEHRPRALTGD